MLWLEDGTANLIQEREQPEHLLRRDRRITICLNQDSTPAHNMTDPSEQPVPISSHPAASRQNPRATLNGYYQGQADFPLTATGREQAAALAERWAGEGVRFDRIITSPLLRARETAEIIAARLDAPLELDPIWMEWANGRLAGMSMVEAREKYPRPAFIDPYMHIGETGESITELYLRAGRAVQGLVDRAPGSYLVVAHGGILNMALQGDPGDHAAS